MTTTHGAGAGAEILVPEDEDALGGVLREAFRFPLDKWTEFVARLGTDAFRVVRRDGEVAGGLALYRMGQVFGRRAVPMWGVAAVGVSPIARGRGLGRALMASTVVDLAERRVPISALYPATVSLYRSVGYGYAGNRFLWAVDADRIGVRAHGHEIREITPDDPEVREAYRLRALRTNGNLDRNEVIWGRVGETTPDAPLYGYGAYGDGRLEAYVFYVQRGRPDMGYDLAIRDLVVLTAEGGRALWALIRDGWSMAREVTWYGPATDPAATLLPQNVWRLKSQLRWMLRICSLPEALTARGWPEGLETELRLGVDDPLVAGNSGTWSLTISGGAAQVERTSGDAELTMGIEALAVLYSGLHDATTLHTLGMLEGGDRVLARADAMFRTSEPWMPDMF